MAAKREETTKNCEACKNYAPLKKPRITSKDCIVYGFCFKDYKERLSIYPVYVPEGVCRDFKEL